MMKLFLIALAVVVILWLIKKSWKMIFWVCVVGGILFVLSVAGVIPSFLQ